MRRFVFVTIVAARSVTAATPQMRPAGWLSRFTLGALLALLLVAALPASGSAQKVKLLVPLDTLVARVARDSLDAPAHYEVALAYWLKHKWDDAERHLRRAIELDSHNAPAYLALSYLPYARNEKLWKEDDKEYVDTATARVLNEAYRLRRHAFLLDPMVDLKPLALSILPPEALGLGRSRGAVYTAIMNGFGSFWDGQYARALQFLSDIAGNATDEDRKKFADWFLWYEGISAAHVMQWSRAHTNMKILLDRAVAQEHPDSSAVLPFATANHYRYTLAYMLERSGRTKDAVALYQEVLANDLGLFMAHSRLAAIHESERRLTAAVQERKRAVAANPEDPVLPYELGETLARAGELLDAQVALRQARQANPFNVRALYILGHVAQQLEAYAEARGAYEQFIALAPSRFASQVSEARKRLAALPPAAGSP